MAGPRISVGGTTWGFGLGRSTRGPVINILQDFHGWKQRRKIKRGKLKPFFKFRAGVFRGNV